MRKILRQKTLKSKMDSKTYGPVVQWLRYFPCTEEVRVRFTAGPLCFLISLQIKFK